ncbi:MAG: hypothetical protein HZA77_16005 [Candidatus Schekmanbacteria bacterium]|nr:hypothetical protein [Candidatus Schekmanbacteria bacterium]
MDSKNAKNIVFILLFILCISSFFCGYTSAATFNVSTTSQFRQALLSAAGNKADDAIILDAGTYRTTDDGFGTFKFTDTEARNITIKARDGLTCNDVILDGDNTHQVFNYVNSKNAVLTIDRITVKNGSADNYGSGGGIRIGDKNGIYRGSLVVINSAITGNSAFGSGGGICGGSVTVTNSIISANTAGGHGGGIFGGNVTITNSIIYGNSANNFDYSSIYIPGAGGGIYSSGNVTVTSSTIYGNSAYVDGGGIYGKGTFINNIFADNSSDVYFGGDSNVYNNYIDPTKLENEWTFAITKENNVFPSAGSLNFADSDFRLNPGSIAIDKGLNPDSSQFKKLVKDKAVLNALKTDKDGQKRVVGTAIDLGAYESVSTPQTFTITASAGSGGSIAPKGQVKVNSGESTTFTITPKKGYKISKVKVDGVSSDGSETYTFTNITKNHTISATFEKK